MAEDAGTPGPGGCRAATRRQPPTPAPPTAEGREPSVGPRLSNTTLVQLRSAGPGPAGAVQRLATAKPPPLAPIELPDLASGKSAVSAAIAAAERGKDAARNPPDPDATPPGSSAAAGGAGPQAMPPGAPPAASGRAAAPNAPGGRAGATPAAPLGALGPPGRTVADLDTPPGGLGAEAKKAVGTRVPPAPTGPTGKGPAGKLQPGGVAAGKAPKVGGAAGPVPKGGGDGDTKGGADAGGGDLVDAELAEHERWAGAVARVGEAQSEDRAGFIGQQVGVSALKGFGEGMATGVAMGVGAHVAGTLISKLVSKALSTQLAGKFVPLPGIGSVIGGAIAIHGLVTRDWKHTGEVLGKTFEGADFYEHAANLLAGLAEVLDLVSNVMNVIAGVIGLISAVMWIITIATVGVAAPLAGTLSSLAIAIGSASTAIGLIASLVLQPLSLAFRALHEFTSQADPSVVEAEGSQLSAAAGAVGGGLGGLVGGKLAEKGIAKFEGKPAAKPEAGEISAGDKKGTAKATPPELEVAPPADAPTLKRGSSEAITVKDPSRANTVKDPSTATTAKDPSMADTVRTGSGDTLKIPPEEAITNKLPPDEAITNKLPPEEAITKKLPPEDATTKKLPPEDAVTNKLPPEDAVTNKLPPEEAVTGKFRKAGERENFPAGDDARAKATYEAWVRQDPTRECGIWRNTKTGEMFVMQGEKGTVPFGASPDWHLEAHYHPGRAAGGAAARHDVIPSGSQGDLGVAGWESEIHGDTKMKSNIDYPTDGGGPKAKWGNTEFGFDPSSNHPIHMEGPFGPGGKKARVEFSSAAEADAFLKKYAFEGADAKGSGPASSDVQRLKGELDAAKALVGRAGKVKVEADGAVMVDDGKGGWKYDAQLTLERRAQLARARGQGMKGATAGLGANAASEGKDEGSKAPGGAGPKKGMIDSFVDGWSAGRGAGDKEVEGIQIARSNGSSAVLSVSPKYPTPPGTTAQVEAFRAERAAMAEERRKAEEAKKQMAAQEKSHAANEAPIGQAVETTTAGQDAVKEHDGNVDERKGANAGQKGRQQEAGSILDGAPAKMGSLAALEIPLAAVGGMMWIGSLLPGGPGASCNRMKGEVGKLMKGLATAKTSVETQKAQQPTAAAALEAQDARLAARKSAAATAASDFDKANQGAEAAKKTNAERKEKAVAIKGTAAGEAAKFGAGEKQAQSKADDLAGRLATWAEQHRAARKEAIDIAVAEAKAKGLQVTAVRGA